VEWIGRPFDVGIDFRLLVLIVLDLDLLDLDFFDLELLILVIFPFTFVVLELLPILEVLEFLVVLVVFEILADVFVRYRLSFRAPRLFNSGVLACRCGGRCFAPAGAFGCRRHVTLH
jgi:hypothetical protein